MVNLVYLDESVSKKLKIEDFKDYIFFRKKNSKLKDLTIKVTTKEDRRIFFVYKTLFPLKKNYRLVGFMYDSPIY